MNIQNAFKVLVVGGNGFIGSAVCRAALAKGMEVTSLSTSGKPYQTQKGHSPSWTNRVNWLQGDALEPRSFSEVLPSFNAVVHTLGTLLEGDSSGYKEALKNGDLPGVIRNLVGGSSNPLRPVSATSSYEALNRDSAVRVCEAYLDRRAGTGIFAFLSAEDIFRPLISARYIETKREAELRITRLLTRHSNRHRGVYMRPSLVYHAHYRPLTTPIAALLDLSASLHARVPHGIPSPSKVLRFLGAATSRQDLNARTETNVSESSFLESMANALTIPPIHVDHVGEAICVSLLSENVHGPVGVEEMRRLIGWRSTGEPVSPGSRRTAS